MKYKIGDLVRIRIDLKEGEKYNNEETDVCEDMLEYRGKIAKVVDYSDLFHIGIYYYKLDIDDGGYYWSENMLEDIRYDIKEDIGYNIKNEEGTSPIIGKGIRFGETKVTRVTLEGGMWEFLQEKYGVQGDFEKLDEEYKKYKEEKELEKERKRVEELRDLCNEVDKKYAHHCSALDCQECVYYNAPNCKTMFIVDYLKKNDTIL